MLSIEEIRAGLLGIARDEFGKDLIKDLLAEPYVDPDGADSVRVTIVLKPEKNTNLTGKKLAGMTNRANDFMLNHGDERFVFTHYATAKELKELARMHD